MDPSPSATSRAAARQAQRAAARRRRRTVVTTAAAIAGAAVIAAVGFFVALPAFSAPPLMRSAAHTPLSPLVEDPATFTAPALLAVAEAGRPATLTVSAVGDMIFDRQIKTLVVSAGGAAPLAAVASHLKVADVTIGNLESPLSTGGVKNATKDVTFRGDPRGAEGLVASGFDFLSIANNHVLDYGPDALSDTVAALDARGIAHAGAGANRAAAWKPAVIERDGASVAYLAFSHILPAGFVATDSRPGLAAGRNNMDAVATAIRSAKAEHDYVIVSFHWGVEYQDDANGEQVRDAHAAVDAGADMVLAHHPHVIQAVEYYKNRLIAYSLGDFVFDHYSRKTGEAFILDAALGPDGVTDVKVTPVYLDGHGKPEFVTGSEATVILDRLKAISAKRSTLVSIDGNTATVTP